MESERELVRRTLDLQMRGKDYGLSEISNYKLWSERKLREGISPAFIANLDATCMFLLPEEVATVEEEVFEELLEDIARRIGNLQKIAITGDYHYYSTD